MSENVNLRKMVRIIDPVDHLAMVEIIRGMVMTALVVSLGKHTNWAEFIDVDSPVFAEAVIKWLSDN